MLRVAKPKSRRVKRILDNRAPKLEENVKKSLLVNGSKTSSVVKEVLADLHHLKKAEGNSLKLSRKNENMRPFEAGGETSLEFIAQKADCSLFAIGSHSKKRPHNIVFGRMFDHHVYDMVEVGVERHKTIASLKGGGKYAPQVGSKPCFAFIGQDFESRPEMRQVKSLLLDYFRGQVVTTINLAGLDRVFVCVACGDKVFVRHCAIRLKKSGTKIPRVELIEAGPSLDLSIRRSRPPSEELEREAMKTPKASSTLPKVQKNVRHEALAGKLGRVYVDRQDLKSMALRKMKGLKRERREKKIKQKATARQNKEGSLLHGGAEESPRKKPKHSEE
eukprot:TRINITY_DN5830_c0_g2_i1.p1 TRINITY_DN5830_c0_g2~~TRINITY_DN5830_c0_g2_i1.p1  ORF type:complete len:333 (-),score=89.96 TRINITY_DN5830_c0_g2_i1:93-1091(-)